MGLLLLAALAVTAGLALQVGALSSWGDRIEVVVPAPDVAGLQEGAVVSSLGVPVGTVRELRLAGREVRVVLALDPDAGLRADVVPRIRARSLLGEKYVELDPGTALGPLLADGDTLQPLVPQFDVDELVEVVGPLGQSMDPTLFRAVAVELNALLERDPERLERMASDLEVMLANGRLASGHLPELVVEARATLADVRRVTATAEGGIARADALLIGLEHTPETAEEARLALGELRATLAELAGTQERLDQVLTNLSGLTPEEVERMLRDEGIRVRLAGRPPER
ncbi:MAG: MlaD family protein [Myxococcota bacterium]